jgi:hypothetical protein
MFGNPRAFLISDRFAHQVLEQVVATYEELRAGYATADAKISLQSISLQFIFACPRGIQVFYGF